MRWQRFGPGAWWRGTLSAACLVVLASCAGSPDVIHGPDPLANASRISTVPPTLGAPDCDPPSTTRPLRSAVEVRAATSEGTSIWARFAGEPPFPSGEPIEATWRLEGGRAPTVVLVDAGGAETRVGRVERDRTVRWERPGDAWRATIEFAHPGCWRVNVAGEHDLRGDLWVEVA